VCNIFGWKAVGKTVSHVSSPIKAIDLQWGSCRVCEEASSGETHCFVSLMQLLTESSSIDAPQSYNRYQRMLAKSQ